MSKISSEYAAALFELGMEKDSLESFADALELVSDVFMNNPDYPKVLSSYSIPLSERLDLIEKAFSGSVERDVVSFLKLLCEKKHIGEFLDCAKQFKDMLCEINKVSTAKVISAVRLDDDEKKALESKLEKLSGNKVVIDYEIDESILGGLIIEIDGKVMDSSLKKHLKEVKDVINK